MSQPLASDLQERLEGFTLVFEFVRVFLVLLTDPKAIDSLVFCEPPWPTLIECSFHTDELSHRRTVAGQTEVCGGLA